MNISNFQQCSNCGACYSICPQGAITVKEDRLFYVPTVDASLCVECSLCTKVCPVNRTFEGNKPIYACGGWHKDSNIVLSSSSGGVFYGIAKNVISHGGVVFSAAYSDDCRTVRFVSSDDVRLDEMMKSKYVESLVGDSFKRVRYELDSGRYVLFCGTPCQVAGLKSYLEEEYERLITCDFACGGLPSHTIYKEHLSFLEKKYRSKAESVDFRPKSHGWKRYAVKIKFKNGKEYLRLGTEDPYLKSFLYGKLTVRDYCMDCKFSECHASDISIADFWLHDKFSSLKNKNGISLVLCNTPKGKKTIELLKEEYVFSELDTEVASYNNKVQISEKRKENRKLFLDRYKKDGFEGAKRVFLRNSTKEKIRNWIVREFCKEKDL